MSKLFALVKKFELLCTSVAPALHGLPNPEPTSSRRALQDIHQESSITSMPGSTLKNQLYQMTLDEEGYRVGSSHVY